MGRYFVGANQISALLVIENAGGVGISLIDKLRNQLHYPNLYRYIPPAVAKRKRAPVFGFPTTKATKPLIINRLAEYIVPMSDNSCRLLNVYPKLREELSTYVRRENGTTAADIGCHDDLVISLAIGLYVLLEEVQPVGNNVISERVKEGEFRLDLTELYREANVIQKIENKFNRRFWANHRRAVRKTQRRNNRGF
jgi:hypothetical protein